MAMIVQITCLECGKTKYEPVGSGYPPPSVCGQCRAEKADKEKRMHLAGLAALSIEERLAEIEKVLYDEPWADMIRRQNARY